MSLPIAFRDPSSLDDEEPTRSYHLAGILGSRKAD
jgi:hypothetical protein